MAGFQPAHGYVRSQSSQIEKQPEHKYVSFTVSDYAQMLSLRVITAKSKTTRIEHVGDYYKGNSLIVRGTQLSIFIKIVNDTHSYTSRCTLKCINKENMVLNLSEEPTTTM